MANRSFDPFSLSLEKQVVSLFLNFTVGATGAPTLVVAPSKGIKSITRNGVGLYTVVLQDGYNKFLGLDVVNSNSTGISAAPNCNLVSTGTNLSAAGGGTIKFQFVNGAGAATELANGDNIYMAFTLGNSSAP